MQNKPNFPNAQILVNCVLTMDYVNIRLRSRFKNKAKQSQFKANFRKAKMNVSSVKTKDYEKNDIFSVPQNKANSNPIKPNFKPVLPSNSTILTFGFLRFYPPNPQFLICFDFPGGNLQKTPCYVACSFFEVRDEIRL